MTTEQEYDIDVSDYEIDTVDTRNFYVDNDEMLQAYIEYQKERKAALEHGIELPITRYLGECIMKISNHLAYRFNFINYSFREEMVLDGIVTCVRGFNTFNPETSNYIFSYFTTACFRAFIRRIQAEDNQSQVKAKAIYELDVDSIVTQAQECGEYDAEFVNYMKEAQDYKMRPAKEPKIRVPKDVILDFIPLDFD